MGARETARLAWRSRVDAAARQIAFYADIYTALRDNRWLYPRPSPRWSRSRYVNRWVRGSKGGASDDAVAELDAALSSPKPWRSGRKPDPRRRYSRSHRRACAGCRRSGEWLRKISYVTALGLADPYAARFVKFTRDPHGRSDR
jgi:hypothetical protein